VVHFVTFALAVTLPEIINRRPLLDEVVTVNLVSLPDVTQAEPRTEPAAKPEPPVEPEPVAKPEPVKAKVSVAVKPETAPEPVQPVKPVSLKPIKRKIQKTDPDKLAAEQAKRQRDQERLRELAKARQAEDQARLEAERARAALAEMIRQKGTQPPTGGPRQMSGGKEVQSIVFKQYLSSLFDRVQQFWILPQMRQWDAGLETIVVLTILRDGTVAKTVIEKKSQDPFFDQFVMKTIQSATPMPVFPKLMPQASIEVGLRFRPNELLM